MAGDSGEAVANQEQPGESRAETSARAAWDGRPRRDEPLARPGLVAIGILLTVCGGIATPLLFLASLLLAAMRPPAVAKALAAWLGAIVALVLVELGATLAHGGVPEAAPHDSPGAEAPPSAAVRRAASVAALRVILATALTAALVGIGWLTSGSVRALLASIRPALAAPVGQALALIPAWLAQVVLHEGGHALAAVVLGGRLESVGVWPLALRRAQRGWALSLEVGGSAGHTRAAPPRSGWTRGGYLAHLAAGPAASAAFALGCVAVLATSEPSPPTARLLIAGAAAGAWGVVGSARDLRLILAAARAQAFAWTGVGRAVLLAIAEDRRPRAWPHSAAEIAAAAAATRNRGFGLLLAAVRDLDGGEAGAARARLAEIVADPALRAAAAPDCVLQLALCDALLARDPAAARARLDAEELQPYSGGYAALAEAAAAVAEGRPDEAARLLATWRAFVAAQPSPAYARGGNHWAEELIEARLRDGEVVPCGGA